MTEATSSTPEETFSLVIPISVVTTHHMFDHSLVICDIKLGHTKTIVPTRMARNINAIDKADFVLCLRGSLLFTNLALTVDGYTDQTERVTTELLDSIAPLWAVHRKFAPA